MENNIGLAPIIDILGDFSILVPVSQYFMNQRTYNAAYADYQKQMSAIQSGEQDSVNEADFTTEELQQINDAKSLQNVLDEVVYICRILFT